MTGIGVKEIRWQRINQGHATRRIPIAPIFDHDLVGHLRAVYYVILIGICQRLVHHKLNHARRADRCLLTPLNRRGQVSGRQRRNIHRLARPGIGIKRHRVRDTARLSRLDSPKRPGQGVFRRAVGSGSEAPGHRRHRGGKVVHYLRIRRRCGTGILVGDAEMHAIAGRRVVLIGRLLQAKFRLW